jgi:hypothetical protein
MSNNIIKALTQTSFDYSSLGASASTEVVHKEIQVLDAKELILIPRVSARISGTGIIKVIVREFFPANDDASDPVGQDIITTTISGGSPPSAFIGRISGGLPLWVRVLTQFTQSASPGALVCRHEIDVVINES